MMEKTLGLLFYLKPTKNDRGEDRFIYLRITIDGKSNEISLKRKWVVSRWNSRSGRAQGSKEDAKTLNVFLDTVAHNVHYARRKLMDAGKEVSSEMVRNILLGQEEKKRMVLELFQIHNDQMEKLVGKDFAYGTFQRYQTSLEHTKAFILWKYEKSDMEIRDLDYDFISEYSFWLKSVRNCGHNATMKYLSNFKKIVLSCVKKGWLPRDPFFGFKLARREKVREFLTKDELKMVANKKIEIERVGHVRDIFVFCCYTGLAYIDVKQLRRKELLKGVDGKEWLMTQRQKTESPTRLPLLPKALEIVAKYSSHPQCEKLDLVLPVLSNQKMNAYLKELADICGIKKVLTFHIARHTFATTVTLSNGVPIETVSKMLGHKNLSQTQHYAKIIDLKVSEDMQRLEDRLGN
ncbi:site-specific integrase [Dyadobacter psychrotolerans]|uniref:Site-specific integrase n=1 Tax=Dyadobacter psychrotolerans TaxID=2541721 RepID=A0A4R5DZK3_9BACT|nr:site-specific integrase [Dyadobacter psychrotolerans]TDE18134.1 site-specific integrase [Dyadobacter psychrotolerans]